MVRDASSGTSVDDVTRVRHLSLMNSDRLKPKRHTCQKLAVFHEILINASELSILQFLLFCFSFLRKRV